MSLKALGLPAAIITAALVLDQGSKFLIQAVRADASNWSTYLAGVEITYVENSGILAGLFPGTALFVALVSPLLLVPFLLIGLKAQQYGFLGVSGLYLFIGGGIGNGIDRLLHGYVIDFIKLQSARTYIVFNLADLSVTVGLIILVGAFLEELWWASKVSTAESA